MEQADLKEKKKASKRKTSIERKEEILAVAFDVFLEKGYDLTKVEEIAKRAGIAKGLVFFYFSTKEELFKEVLAKYGHSPVRSQIAEVVEKLKEMPLNEQISNLLKYICKFLLANPRLGLLIKLLLGELHREPELARFHQERLIQPIADIIYTLLNQAVESGQVKKENIPQHFQIILAPMFLFILWNLVFAESKIDPDEYARDYSAYLLRALGIHSS